MNLTVTLAIATMSYCVYCSGATNAIPSTIQFFRPPIELRPFEGWESSKPTTAQPAPSRPDDKQVPKSFLDGGDLDATLVARGEQYLQKVQADGDTPLDRIFKPEVVHLGSASFSCPILTVIKRRNPLCLLSALSLRPTLTGDGEIGVCIFDLSW